jgi:hypothetical protein
VLNAENRDFMRFYYADYILLGSICSFIFIFCFDYSYRLLRFDLSSRFWNINKHSFAIISFIVVLNFYFELKIGSARQTQREITISPLAYSFLGTFRYLGYMLLAYYVSMNIEKPRVLTFFILTTLFLFLTYFGFLSGSKSVLLYPLITILICREAYFKPSQSKRFFVLLLGLTLMPLLLVFQTLREVQFSLNIDRLTVTNYRELLDQVFQSVNLSEIDAYYYFIQRLNNLGIVSNILRLLDEGGIMLGSTYLRFFWFIIPRPLWPEKPSMTFGREFTVIGDYGPADGIVLGVPMSNTSVGVTAVGESLLNFGPFFIIVALFIGGLSKYLDKLVISQNNKLAKSLLNHFFWFNFLFVLLETNLAAILAGLVKLALFLLLIHKIRFR